MDFIRSGWGLFVIAMGVTLVVSVIAECIEAAVYNKRESEYIKYNGQFSEIFKGMESPYADKKKKRKSHTTLLIMSWILTGAAMVALAVKLNWITKLYQPILWLMFSFPVLLIASGIIYAILASVLLLTLGNMSGAKRTILKIRKRYKIED